MNKSNMWSFFLLVYFLSSSFRREQLVPAAANTYNNIKCGPFLLAGAAWHTVESVCLCKQQSAPQSQLCHRENRAELSLGLSLGLLSMTDTTKTKMWWCSSPHHKLSGEQDLSCFFCVCMCVSSTYSIRSGCYSWQTHLYSVGVVTPWLYGFFFCLR